MSKRRKGQQTTKLEKVEYMSYQAFFANCVAKKLVKPWQEKEVQMFFRDLGLTDKEPADKYLDALAKY